MSRAAASPLPPLARHTPAQGAATAPRTTLAEVRATTVVPGWTALAVAAGLSVAVHLTALGAFPPGPEVSVEGGAPPALAALGHSFEDFVQGAQPTIPTTAPAAQPAIQSPARPQTPAIVSESATAPPSLPQFADPVALAIDVAPPPVPLAPAEHPAPVLAPAAPKTAQGAQAPTTTAQEVPDVSVSQATPETPRPQARPDPTARTAAASPSQPAGNAPQDARRGVETGRPDAPAARAGTAEIENATSGSAAASSYPGEVLRRLQRTAQPRVSARGRAVVEFTIADSGALAGVSIAGPSGSAAVDQAALDHIRRAAPFPPPPAGAQRAYRFEFVSR